MSVFGGRLFIAVPFFLAVAGCVSTSPQEDPVAIRLASLDNRLSVLERVVENQSLLELANQVQAMQAEIRALRGQAETLAFEAESGRKRQRDLYLDLDRRLSDLEASRAAGPAGRSGGLPDVPSPLVTDTEAYEAAFEKLKERQYEASADGFASFLQNYPESELAGNAQYWLGEAKYVMQKFEDALPEFQKVTNDYPDSRKVPDALLKIGYCHYELENWDAAKAAFQKAVSDFPDTTASGLAAQRLERMKREGR
ncbi:MAG: tol-pal system protein YbgF [Gammaproteobacteria bacterium]|nr:tol-pal system protein YbgF [Gammaproteobacteria bacterium]